LKENPKGGKQKGVAQTGKNDSENNQRAQLGGGPIPIPKEEFQNYKHNQYHKEGKLLTFHGKTF